MVRRTRRKWNRNIIIGCAMAGASAGLSGTPASAQDRPASLLERMQDEVAGVARQSRAAIVTIEDSRAITLNYFNSSLRKTDLEEQITLTLTEKKAEDANVAQQQARFNAGAATLRDLAKPRAEQARLETRLAFLRQRLANVGKEDALTIKKAEYQMLIDMLEADLNNSREALRVEQQRFAAGLSSRADILELQSHLISVQVSLTESRRNLAQASASAAPNGINPSFNAFTQSGAPRSGSGFSIGDGLIVTTADVVQGMNTPVVSTDDGRQARASVVAVDSRLNIALLRLSANLNLPALRLGDSANVAPGHFAITIGNQTGQANSVALSTISALKTQGTTSAAHYYPELLQIDGTVSAGTSGAPVLNARGEVIGMLAAAPAAMPIADASGFTPGTSYRYEVSLGQGVQLKSLQMTGSYLPGATSSSLALPATPNTKPGNITLNGTFAAPPTVQPPALAAPPARSTPDTPVKPFSKTSVPEPGKISPPKSSERSIQMLGTAGQTLRLNWKMFPNQSPPLIYRASDAPFNTSASVSLPASSSSGFAIPVNAMKSVLDELKTGHNVVHAWLGLNLEDADNARYENGIVSVDRQVKIAGIYDRSPVSKAGLKQTGDILTGLNDIAVHTSNDVRAAVLLRFKPGQSITAHLLRAGKPLDIPVTLEAAPTDVPPLLNAVNTRTIITNLQYEPAVKLP